MFFWIFVFFFWRIWKNLKDLLGFFIEKESQGPFVFFFWRLKESPGLIGFFHNLLRDSLCVFLKKMKESQEPMGFFQWQGISGSYCGFFIKRESSFLKNMKESRKPIVVFSMRKGLKGYLCFSFGENERILGNYWVFSMRKNLRGPLCLFLRRWRKNLQERLGFFNWK